MNRSFEVRFSISLSKLLALAIYLGVASPAFAEPANGVFNSCVTVKNDTGVAKDDFHVTITSDKNISVTHSSLNNLASGGEEQINGKITPSPAKNVMMAMVDWDLKGKDVPVMNGKVIKWGVGGAPADARFSVESYFTPKKVAVNDVPTDVPSVGWLVDDSGDIYLVNGWSADVHFEDLYFQFSSSQISLDSALALLDSPPSGVPGLVSAGTIPGGSPGSPGSLLVGSFLSELDARMSIAALFNAEFADSNFSPLMAYNALTYSPIPEPSGLAMIAIGFTAIGSWCVRRQSISIPA